MYWQLDGTNLHLVGSIHFSKSPLVLTPTIRRILDEADVVAFEANLDLKHPKQTGLYPSSNGLSKNIPNDLFLEAQSVWDTSVQAVGEFDRHLPWHAAFILMNALLRSRGFIAANGVDMQVNELAKLAKKNLFYLETSTQGFEPFRAAPHDEQVKFLSTVVRQVEEGIQDVTAMGTSWERNDPTLLNPILEKSIRLMPKSYAGALGGRNRQWFPKLLKLARGRRRCVAIVGALHMIGEDGLPAMFGEVGIHCQHVAYCSHA